MKRAVICFTRFPKAGKTKTRLLPLLSPKQCEGLHWTFLQDLSAVFNKISADLFIAYTDDPDWEQLKAIFPTAIACFPQTGEDLGEKMKNAIASVLERGYEAVILTGSDLPCMRAEHLFSGFTALEEVDVCFGPTSDGGYYLVGMKQLWPEVFKNQQYGGSTVWEKTLAAAKGAGCSLGIALPCDDVDTPDDLRCLWSQIAYNGSHTAIFLEELQKEGVSL